jgi:hypothetical protein
MSAHSAEADLMALIPTDSWRAARVHGRQAIAMWCPILDYDRSRAALGLARPGEWWWDVNREDEVEIYPLAGDAVVGTLPLLEIPFAALRSRVRESATRLGLSPQQVMSALPIATILRAALKTRSDYWVALAVEWLEDSGTASQVRDAIQSAAFDRRLEQSLRHRLWWLASDRVRP